MRLYLEGSQAWGDVLSLLAHFYPQEASHCGYFDSGYLGYEAAEGIDWSGKVAPLDGYMSFSKVFVTIKAANGLEIVFKLPAV